MNRLLVIQFFDKLNFQLARNFLSKFWVPESFTINEQQLKISFEYPTELQANEIEIAFMANWIYNYSFSYE